MKKLNLLLFLLLPFLSACNDACENLECISENIFSFTIQSSDSGEDLLFGNGATLTTNDVEIYYISNGTRQPAQLQVLPSYIDVYLERGVNEYFVQALDQTDAIRIDFTEIPSSECCPSTIRRDRITVNGIEIGADSWIITLVR